MSNQENKDQEFENDFQDQEIENENLNDQEEVSDNQEEENVVENLRAELDKEKNNFLRLFAEFENYKKRTSKERIELFSTANRELMAVLLPIMDGIDR